jgi:DNA-binding NarL/FixJ family response regulator
MSSADTQIRVAIVDDDPLVRAALTMMLRGASDIEIVGEAADGESGVALVGRERPDVVLLDIRMPVMDGLEATAALVAAGGPSRIIVLTTFDADEYVARALGGGASGFLLKDTPSDRLLDAVRVAAAGEALIAPSITRRLIEQFARGAQPGPGAVPPALAELTGRELDVLRLVARGLSNAEIAAELVLGENTIKTHVAHVFAKLGLRDRVQAVVLAYETGFVTRELAAAERTAPGEA